MKKKMTSHGLTAMAWEFIPFSALGAGDGETQLSQHTTHVGQIASSVNSQCL